jgi:translation initiation factor 4A
MLLIWLIKTEGTLPLPDEIPDAIVRSPIRIPVEKNELTLQGIKEFCVTVEAESWKFGTLTDVCGTIPYETGASTQAVIFCNTHRKVDWLTEKLIQHGFKASAVHGDMDNFQQELIMKEFNGCSSSLLVATDGLVKGIEVSSVLLVFNYDCPTNFEKYTHRIERSGLSARNGYIS